MLTAANHTEYLAETRDLKWARQCAFNGLNYPGCAKANYRAKLERLRALRLSATSELVDIPATEPAKLLQKGDQFRMSATQRVNWNVNSVEVAGSQVVVKHNGSHSLSLPLDAKVFLPRVFACYLPPKGWWCSRRRNHSGPCAARRDHAAAA